MILGGSRPAPLPVIRMSIDGGLRTASRPAKASPTAAVRKDDKAVWQCRQTRPADRIPKKMSRGAVRANYGSGASLSE